MIGEAEIDESTINTVDEHDLTRIIQLGLDNPRISSISVSDGEDSISVGFSPALNEAKLHPPPKPKHVSELSLSEQVDAEFEAEAARLKTDQEKKEEFEKLCYHSS